MADLSKVKSADTINPTPEQYNNVSPVNTPPVEDLIRKETPNEITVTIQDQKSPIVILFGARASGKTMTLVRLTRYLRNNGYSVEPNKIFRASNDKYYEERCNDFDKSVNSTDAADTNDVLNFMLLDVREKGGGSKVCQILEAPGEHYFDTEHDMDFPPYIKEISKRKNQRIWIFIVEVDWLKDENIRRAYASKVAKMRNTGVKANDKIIVMCHKVDKQADTHFFKGFPNKKEFLITIKEQYPEIFDSIANKSWLSFAKPYDDQFVDFIAFSAGGFNDYIGSDGKKHQKYIEGEDEYPRDLWNAIKKARTGNWF